MVDATADLELSNNQSQHPSTQITLRCAFVTAVYLGGGIGFPFWFGLLVYLLPISVRRTVAQFLPIDMLLNALADMWFLFAIVGAAMWGRELARILAHPRRWRVSSPLPWG
jgi:hypothetical protein